MSHSTTPTTFRGFADYAADPTSTTDAALLAARGRDTNNDTSSSSGQAQQQRILRPSPVYTGNDTRITVLFRKIGRKSDPVTRIRGLEELVREVYPPPSSLGKGSLGEGNNEGGGGSRSRDYCHYFLLYASRENCYFMSLDIFT